MRSGLDLRRTELLSKKHRNGYASRRIFDLLDFY